MTIVIVDDEEKCVQSMLRILKKIVPRAKLYPFQFPKEVLAFAKENPIDIAFLDIEMVEINGVTLAKQLKNGNPKLNVVFVTAYEQYREKAFDMFVSGYMMKPIQEEKVKQQLEHLRFPVVSQTGVRIKTFGYFEIFVDDKPLTFKRSKAKELLAYLVDRKGKAVTKKQIAHVLFEEKEYNRNVQDYLKKIIWDMEHTLKEAGVSTILKRSWNSYAVDTTQFSCDLYEWQEGRPWAVNLFQNKYMIEYSWGEETLGTLYDG